MYAYVQNHFIKVDSAKVNINNRSFKFGDGFFDNIIIHKSKIINWDYHASQLKNNMQLTRMSIDIDFIKSVCIRLIDLNHFEQGIMRISISRGDGGSGFLADESVLPYIVVQASNIDKYDFSPVDVYLSKYKKHESDLARVKSESGLRSSLLRLEARDNNCFDTLCLDQNNMIAECSSSNIFWINNGKYYTPSASLPIYLGSARNMIIKLLKNQGVEIIEGKFSLEELVQADEAFITNTRWLIRPIKNILLVNKRFHQFDISQKIANTLLNSFK